MVHGNRMEFTCPNRQIEKEIWMQTSLVLYFLPLLLLLLILCSFCEADTILELCCKVRCARSSAVLPMKRKTNKNSSLFSSVCLIFVWKFFHRKCGAFSSLALRHFWHFVNGIATKWARKYVLLATNTSQRGRLLISHCLVLWHIFVLFDVKKSKMFFMEIRPSFVIDLCVVSWKRKEFFFWPADSAWEPIPSADGSHTNSYLFRFSR